MGENPHEAGTEAWAREVSRPHVSRYGNRPHNPAYCCAAVHDGGRSVGFHQCNRKPKVHYGGLGYCNLHDPAAVIAKREKWQRDFDAKWAAQRAAAARAEAERRLRDDALEAIRQIAAGHNDPRALASALLERHEASAGVSRQD